MNNTLIIVFLSVLVSFDAMAEDSRLFQWHTTDVQLLQGFSFELGERERTILTLQHAHGWTFGDNYLFYDNTLGRGDEYFEWHPRLSLSKISGASLAFGPVKDVLLAGTLEVPENGSARLLGGIGFDWDIPSFNFVKTNFYVRDNPDLDGTTWGTTFAWKNKFKIGDQPFLFDGFMDMAGAEGNRTAYQLVVPALLADIGTHMGFDDQLYFGTEYQYWNNKFGVDGADESVAQLELRWVFK